jgi:hypothetical protein
MSIVFFLILQNFKDLIKLKVRKAEAKTCEENPTWHYRDLCSHVFRGDRNGYFLGGKASGQTISENYASESICLQRFCDP